MGFLEENGNSEVYKHLTKPGNRKKKQRWTLYLALCCMTICLASFQFGYNIGSLNLVTPVIKHYFDQVYFKELFHDKLAMYREGEQKIINGTLKFNDRLDLFFNKSTYLKEKERELIAAENRRDTYMDTLFSMDLEKIAKAKKAKAEAEKMIKEKYNLTVEVFLNEARIKIDNGKIKLKDAEKKLRAGLVLIRDGNSKLDEKKPLLIAGRKKLDTLGNIIWGITNSLFVIGGLVGALTSKYALDHLGRKNGILFHYIFSIIGSIMLFSQTFLDDYSKLGPVLVKLGRFFQGVQGGMSCSIVPTFLSEIAPSSLRGQIGVIHNLFLTLGLLTSQFLGFESILGNHYGWIFLLSMPIFPAIIGVFLLYFFFDDSPKYLLFERSEEGLAIKALRKLRNTENVSSELHKLYVEGSEMLSHANMSVMSVLKAPELRFAIASGILLQIAQQFCGINAIFFYSRRIFETAGISEDYIQLAVILTGIVNVFCTFICVQLVDRIGRKPLLIGSMSIMFIDLILLVVCILNSDIQACNIMAVICILFFIISYAVGLGPIPFIYVAESFKQNSRSSAMSICVFCNWFSNLILVLMFPILIDIIGGYVFIIFSCVILVTTLYMIIWLPETKGRSAEEIQNIFNKKRSSKLHQLNPEITA